MLYCAYTPKLVIYPQRIYKRGVGEARKTIMSEINLDAFKYSVSKIDDGFVFEEFGQSFLSAILGHKFIPVGGTKDKGVDGFQHNFHKDSNESVIYQFSTESNVKAKIENTITKLKENKRKISRLFYVTNRDLNNTELISDQLSEKHKIPITIYPLKWFVTNAMQNEGTINAYNIFVTSYFHEFSAPGKSFVVSNLDKDSRLYVFLRQQLEEKIDDLKIDEVLTDTLILFALEGTDPDKGIFKTKEEIIQSIKEFVKFDPKILSETIYQRLEVLTTKPRKVKYHIKLKGYCLPYETRLEIQSRNLQDKNLIEIFQKQTEEKIKKYFKDADVSVKNLSDLIDKTIHKIYYQQGLEFSNFIINCESKGVIEKDLQDIIGHVVDESAVVIQNKEKVKTALLMAIRDIAYNGTIEQKKYLRSLSNTYMMMFLLQWEPKLAIYFQSLASKLNIFVCTSIIIPALSEYYLEPENKRHWNLLVSAHKAGISLYINETILDELVSHFRMLKNKYYKFFYHTEANYLGDENQTLFIDEILIRAYFYAKMRGKVKSYDDFINNFLGPNLKTAKDDLVLYLNEVFGIKYVTNEQLGIKIDEEEKSKLLDKLKGRKNFEVKAETDTKLILAVYQLREKNNETATSGIFGYKTWWLSKDTSTYKAVTEAFGEEKFPISCYIRPDFIYNYITLTPKKAEVDEAYDRLFPTLLGVNLSFHLPKDVTSTIQVRIAEFGDKQPVQLKRILRQLSDKLKSDPKLRNKKAVTHFLDDELKKIKG